MLDLILHHYPMSPFAEKIRLVLGYKKLAWKSVIIPRMMPKADVVALTGGYRRTPVLQIGADIYCDTALICDVLEHRRPSPSLHPPGSNGRDRIIAQWADSTLFWAAMGYSFTARRAPHSYSKAKRPKWPRLSPKIAPRCVEVRAACTLAMPPPLTSRTCAGLRAWWTTSHF
jgi:glutathione S-transferase